MDKVRLGRALGYGTRHAARTVAAVVEAATAPDPSAAAARESYRGQPPASQPAQSLKAGVASRSRDGQRQNVRRAGGALWAPLATYSHALWYRVTGLFFAMVAVVMAGGAWRQRSVVLHPAVQGGSPQRLGIFLAFAALFAYFAVSSFLRASRRERQTT